MTPLTGFKIRLSRVANKAYFVPPVPLSQYHEPVTLRWRTLCLVKYVPVTSHSLVPFWHRKHDYLVPGQQSEAASLSPAMLRGRRRLPAFLHCGAKNKPSEKLVVVLRRNYSATGHHKCIRRTSVFDRLRQSERSMPI